MSAAPDEDALAWAGETDPSHVAGPAPVERAAQADVAGRPQSVTSSLLLVSYGVLGGVYLIYTLGWLISIQRSMTSLPNLFDEIMFQFGEFLAIASPAIWFAAIFLLTGRRPIIRLLLLMLGIVVLVPWPFVLGV